MDLTRTARTLLAQVRASRVTVRLDVATMNFPVVAEAVAPGIKPAAGDQSIDQRNVPTVKHILETKELLIQPNFSESSPAPPPALLTTYGTRAQMLSPILGGAGVIGYISVHSSDPRPWSKDDIDSLHVATTQIASYFSS